MSTVLAAAVTAALAISTVALWTARVALTSRKREGAAAALAAVEATVFVTAVARLMSDLDDPAQLVAYAGGVAIGTMLAMRVLRVIEPTSVKVDVVVPGDAHRLLTALHASGWPTTTLSVEGLNGPATTISVTTSEDRLPALYATIGAGDPSAFWTTTELRSVRPTPLPAGFVQVPRPGRRRRRRPASPQLATRRCGTVTT